MRNVLKGVLLASVSASFAIFGQAQASSTEVVLNLEGNPTCYSLGDNHSVLEERVDGASGTIELPTTLGGTQYVDLVVGDVMDSDGNVTEGIQSWKISGITNANQNGFNAINYIILKNQGNAGARVFHYGATVANKGEIEGTSMPSRGSRLASISFCYGLTTGVNSNSEDLADLPSCDEIDTNGDSVPGDLYTTGITCPDPIIGPDGKVQNEQLIINFGLNEPNMGFVGNSVVRACTCNTTLPACNPDLDVVDVTNDPTQQDELTSSQRSCLEYDANGVNANGVAKGVMERTSFHIEVGENPDSYVCYTIGGKRYCYGHY